MLQGVEMFAGTGERALAGFLEALESLLLGSATRRRRVHAAALRGNRAFRFRGGQLLAGGGAVRAWGRPHRLGGSRKKGEYGDTACRAMPLTVDDDDDGMAVEGGWRNEPICGGDGDVVSDGATMSNDDSWRWEDSGSNSGGGAFRHSSGRSSGALWCRCRAMSQLPLSSSPSALLQGLSGEFGDRRVDDD